MSTPSCPRCGTEVGATWRWCLACGYDPDGTQRRIRDEHIERHLRKGSWAPVLVVVAGVLIGATVLWRTAPEDDTTTRATPAVSQVVDWQTYVPEDGGFRVDFPAPPFADDTVSVADGRPEQTYVAMLDEQFFSVVVSDTGNATLDAGVSDEVAESTLRAEVARAARVAGAELGAATLTHVSAAPALDYEIDTGTTSVRGRAVLLGRQVFNVVVGGAPPASADAARFLDSFALT